MENLAQKYKTIALQNEKITQNKIQKRAERDLPKFLKVILKKIERASAKGETHLLYFGSGFFIIANWNFEVRELLKEKLHAMGFDCRTISTFYKTGLVIYWRV
jgi:hypothetical protein